MSLVTFLLALLIVARITRFITSDVLGGHLRVRVYRRFGIESELATLVGCPWCMSIWVSAAVTPLAYFYGASTPFLLVGVWLGISYLYSLAAKLLDD